MVMVMTRYGQITCLAAVLGLLVFSTAARSQNVGVQELGQLPTAFAGSDFGRSVAATDERAVVGAPNLESTGGGRAFVYQRSGTSWIEDGELSALDGADTDQFGLKVAIDGDTVVVGAPQHAGVGAAYVFVRDASGWSQEAKLEPSLGTPHSTFGQSVAISGDRAVVGYPWDDPNGNFSGSVYVYDRAGGVWSEDTRLTAFLASTGQEFGYDVALKDEWLLIGTPQANTSVTQGTVFLFERTGLSWTYHGTLDSPGGFCFGEALAYDGATAVIGAPVSEVAYAYARSGTSWSLEATWSTSDFRFGSSVAVAGDRAFVGAPASNLARAYLREGGQWSEGGIAITADFTTRELGTGVAVAGDCLIGGATSLSVPGDGRAFAFRAFPYETVFEDFKLTNSEPVESQRFGHRIAADGDTLVVSAPGFGQQTHETVVFVRQGTSWNEQAVLTTSDGLRVASSLAISGDTIVAGTTQDNHGTGNNAGSAYVFVRSGTTWSEQAKLIAPDHDGGDQFAFSLAVDGDTIAIGAPEEWNLNGPRAGSVYVFVRNGTNWNFTAKLRASDGALRDHLGRSVDLVGDRIVTGANEAETGEEDSGAAYVFVRSAGVWSEEAKLTPSLPDPNGQFGYTTGIHGDRIVVCAPNEDGIGAVYSFERDGTQWTERQRIPGIQFGSTDFAASLDIAEDRLLLGRPKSSTGRAFLFAHSGASWTLVDQLAPLGSPTSADFAVSVALAGETAFVGAEEESTSLRRAGAVYGYGIPEVFPSFCDASDEALAFCPCTNPGWADTGCDLPQGTGGVKLEVLARSVSPSNRATFLGTGFPPATTPSATLIRSSMLDPAGAVVFGDGLRCIGIPLARVGAGIAVGGSATYTSGHGAMAGPGTFYYQLHLRSTPVMFCDPLAAFNLSNGQSVTW